MNTITVIGEAFDEILPDRVAWRLEVTEVDTSASAAFDRCTTRAAGIADALAAFEITTGQIRISPEWHSHGHKQTGRKIAETSLRVTAPLERATAVAAAAMDAGADELSGPRLKYPDDTAARDALLSRAVEAARRNADAIAAAAGRRAGRVLSVTDPDAADTERRSFGISAAAASGGGDEEEHHRDLPVIARPRRLSAALIVVVELVD